MLSNKLISLCLASMSVIAYGQAAASTPESTTQGAAQAAPATQGSPVASAVGATRIYSDLQTRAAIQEFEEKVRGKKAGQDGVFPAGPNGAPGAMQAPTQQAPAVQRPKKWSVVAIYGSGGQFYADLAKDDLSTTVSVGDNIEGMVISEISQNRVVASKGKKKSTLPVWQLSRTYQHLMIQQQQQPTPAVANAMPAAPYQAPMGRNDTIAPPPQSAASFTLPPN